MGATSVLGAELAVAAANGIRLLLIAEQTRNVAMSGAQGVLDGRGNARNIFALFGADALAALGSEFLVYLDVEGDPSLSTDYWNGWSEGLAAESAALSGYRVSLLPAIYASQGDGPTWEALAKAVANGAVCDSIWIASYETTSGAKVPIAPVWLPARAKTGETALAAPIDLLQYAGGFQGTPYEALDPDVLNPASDRALFLSRCILPV